MTDEMVALANSAKRSAGFSNVNFVAGRMEEIPLPEESVDVVISNCAINLVPDKSAVLGEMARVLRPDGRIGICDVVASDLLSREDRAARGSHVDCIAGALSVGEYSEALSRAGFEKVRIEAAHAVADGMFAASITARKSRRH